MLNKLALSVSFIQMNAKEVNESISVLLGNQINCDLKGVCIPVCMSVCACMPVCICVCIYACMCVCLCTGVCVLCMPA